MAIIFALLTLIGWGVGDVFVTIASRKGGNTAAFFWGMVISITLSSLYIPFAGPISDFGIFSIATILGFALSWGTLFYYKALEVGKAQLVGTIGGSFILPVVIFSMIFFKEKIIPLQVIGITCIFAGLILSTLDFQIFKGKRLQDVFSDKGIKYVLIAMMVWGAYFSIIRVVVERIGWFWSFYPANLFFIPFLFFRRISREEIIILKDKHFLVNIIIFSVLILMAQFAYNLGILNGYTSVVAPIAGSYPVLFVLLARFIFKEKLTNQQKLGIISSLAGILLLAFASGY